MGLLLGADRDRRRPGGRHCAVGHGRRLEQRRRRLRQRRGDVGGGGRGCRRRADESSRETSSMMWFSIDASAKPSAIVWDPVTGLSANPLSGASAAASLSLAVVLSAVLVAAFAM